MCAQVYATLYFLHTICCLIKWHSLDLVVLTLKTLAMRWPVWASHKLACSLLLICFIIYLFPCLFYFTQILWCIVMHLLHHKISGADSMVFVVQGVIFSPIWDFPYRYLTSVLDNIRIIRMWHQLIRKPLYWTRCTDNFII